MTDYAQVTDFSAKDSLPSGDSGKVIYGADVDAELSLISTAIASKLDKINTLSEDTAPIGTTDYLATYDASATAYKKVLLNRIGPGKNTAAWLRGNATQVLSAASTTIVTCLGGEGYDLGSLAASSKFTLASAAQDGYYLCIGRVVFDNTAGQRRVGVAVADSGNNLVTHRYTVATGTTSYSILVETSAILPLTYGAGDYICLTAYSEPGETLASSTSTELYVVRVA